MDGEYGAGYLSSNSLTDWPFETGSAPLRVARLFSDAMVFFPSMHESIAAFVGDVSVSDDGTMSFSLCATDSNGEEFELRHTVNGSPNYITCRLSGRGINAFFVVDGWHVSDSETFRDEGPFPVRSSCVSVESGKLLSLSIMNSEDGTSFPVVTASGIKGDVAIMGGYNVTVERSDSVENGITISASSGSGKGVVPCDCDEDDGEDRGEGCPDGTLRREGNVSADPYGSLVVESDHCMSVVPFREIGTLMLYGRCNAPCTVDMYLDDADDLKGMAGRISGSKDDLMDVAERYMADVRATRRDICKYLVVSGSVNQLPYGDGTVDLTNSAIKGTLNRLSAKVNIANSGPASFSVSIVESSASGDGGDMLLKRGVVSVPEPIDSDIASRSMLYASVSEHGVVSWPEFVIPPGTAADVTSLFFSPKKGKKRSRISGRYRFRITAASSGRTCTKSCEVEF